MVVLRTRSQVGEGSAGALHGVVLLAWPISDKGVAIYLQLRRELHRMVRTRMSDHECRRAEAD